MINALKVLSAIIVLYSCLHAGINPYNGTLSGHAKINERIQAIVPNNGIANTLTTTINPGVTTLLLIPTGAVTTCTVTMPSGVYNGHVLTIACSGANISTLTMNANVGQTVNAKLTSINSDAHGAWIYYSGTWYRKE